MPTPVTVLVTVDASGAIKGSREAQQAITTAVNNIGGTAQKMGAQSGQASRFLERFGDAPKRGISALDALNSTIIQATGGFQALGPASAAASTGLRAALFGVSSLLGPIATITLALGALATVFILTANSAEKTSKAVKENIETLQLMAKGIGPAATAAQFTLAAEAKKLTDQIGLQSQQVIDLTEAYKLAKLHWPIPYQLLHGVKPTIKDISAALQEQTGILAGLEAERRKVRPFEKPEKPKAERDKLAEARLSVELQRIKDIIEGYTKENQVIMEGIQLRIAQQGLLVRQATTAAEVRAGLAAEIALLRERLNLELQGILTDDERANKRLELQNLILQKTQAANAQIEQIENEQKRRNREVEQTYQRIEQMITDNIVNAFWQAKSAAEAFDLALKAIIKDLIEMAARALLGKIIGGAIGFVLGGPAGAVIGQEAGGEVLGRPSVPLTLPRPSGGNVNIVINLSALDTETLTSAVRSRVIPIIENAAAGRRTRIALN